MTTRPCRFFLAGNCRNGADCRFYHEGFSTLSREDLFSSSPEQHHETESRTTTRSSSTSDPLSGEPDGVSSSSSSAPTASALHSSAEAGATRSSSSSGPPAYAATRPCRWYMAGYCLRGDSCWFSHDRSIANSSQRRRDIVVLSDDDEAAADSGVIEGPTSGTASSPSVGGEVADEEDQRCAICFEVPTTFGLLVSCNHAFCLTCIRTWRSKDISSDPYDTNSRSNSVTKACPNCRTPSLYVVPSSFFPACEEQKQVIIQNYKEAAGRTRCKYFQDSGTRRWCPFGDRCFFAHLDENGEPCRVNQDSDPRRRRRRGGAMESLSETLSFVRDSMLRPRNRRSNNQDMDLEEFRNLFIQLARIREIRSTWESRATPATTETRETDSAGGNSWDSQVMGVISDLYAPDYDWGDDEVDLDLDDDYEDSYYHDLDDIDDLDDSDDYLDEEYSYRYWTDHPTTDL